jgi:hypothetical protein
LLNNEKQVQNGRCNAGTKNTRVAVKALYKWREIRERLPDAVGVRFLMNGANIATGWKTILIYDAGSSTFADREALSIPQFNALDIDAAVKRGGKFANLLTKAEKPDKPEGKLASGIPQVLEMINARDAHGFTQEADAFLLGLDRVLSMPEIAQRLANLKQKPQERKPSRFARPPAADGIAAE